MYHPGKLVGYFGNLVAAELEPLFVGRRVFLLARVVSVEFPEFPDHGRMIAVVPFRVFLILNDAVAGPQGGRENNVYQAVVVYRNPVQALHLAISLYFILQISPDFGQGGAEEFIIIYIRPVVGQAFALAVYAEPFRMSFHYGIASVFEIHSPQPGINLDSVFVGNGYGQAVIVGGRGVEHHSVEAGCLHQGAYRIEVHRRTIVQPGPEHRIPFPLLRRGSAGRRRKDERQQAEKFQMFHIALNSDFQFEMETPQQGRYPDDNKGEAEAVDNREEPVRKPIGQYKPRYVGQAVR